ncbi:unnamed protein product [Effrenium voratum]|uniref:CSD domain-containing protein n=1 Tax=Effrenium voratum TaxID=2562239 RepID=A0AA36NFD8_9DINO|nr:unnamed protein product [Effrenium voratum]CAJ1413099.1 unnamed protein product [Effrenium voratum]
MLPAGEEQAGLVVPPLVQLPPEQYADLLTGSVKCWFEDRGFGFIRPEGGEEDVFVHKKVLKDGQSLIEGSSVMFNLTYDADRRRFQATRCFGATLPPEEAPAMPRKWKLPFCLADPWEELYSLPGAEHLRSHLSTGAAEPEVPRNNPPEQKVEVANEEPKKSTSIYDFFEDSEMM